MSETILFSSSVFPTVWNYGKRSIAKICHAGNLPSVTSKVFEKVQNNKLFDHLHKCVLCFRPSRSTVDPLAVVCNKTTKDFNRPGASRSIILYIEKISKYLILFCTFSLTEGWKKENYPINAGGPRNSILGTSLFLL